jgi:hypothetical protein
LDPSAEIVGLISANVALIVDPRFSGFSCALECKQIRAPINTDMDLSIDIEIFIYENKTRKWLCIKNGYYQKLSF